MKRIAWLLVLAPSLLAAQTPSDTGGAARDGRQRREAWVGRALGLSADQAAKLEATRARFAPQRRALMARRRAIFEGFRGQLQRDEEKEIAGYLSPVQRARLDLLRERFAGMRSRRGPGGRRGRGGWGSRESWHRARPQ